MGPVIPHTALSRTGACEGINFVGRSTWGAKSPKNTPSPLNQDLDYYIIHHTDTPECSTQSACSRRVKSIQDYHMNTKGWNDIGYSFLIGGDNQVYEGRGWDNEGAHAKGFNSRSIGIAIIGDYTGDQPDSDVVDTLNSLMMCGVELGNVKTDYDACVHSDFSSTECPGDALRNLVHSWRLCDR